MIDSIKAFLIIKSSYDSYDAELRQVIDEMGAIYTSDDSSESQKQMAMHTLLEALFPK
jgi:hypothetical protein